MRSACRSCTDTHPDMCMGCSVDKNGLGHGGVPEWLKGADCKSAGGRLRRFESYPHHFLLTASSGQPSVSRLVLAVGAEVSWSSAS